MTCRGFIDSLALYLSEELSADQRATFEAHRAECPNCAVYLKSYADTIALAKDASGHREDPGEPMPEDLVQAILAARVKSRIS
jgi:anti-sigma factor RsiW